jgi:AcrR family transcriptional regulator
MAPVSKKKKPPVLAPKKPRLSQAEATVRMLNATSQLLVENVPGEVTVARICEAAGVHTDYVVRYFGSREELLCQAIEAAFQGIFLKTSGKEATRLEVALDGYLDIVKLREARARTITYLLGCGVSPDRFKSSQKLVLESVFEQSSNPSVSDRSKWNLILAGSLIIQGMSTFAEVNDMTEQQKQDMLAYIGYMSQSGETVQAALGWDKPAPKKKAKK